MKKEFIRKEIILWVIISIPIIYMFTVWSKLPGELPSHWDMSGNVNGYVNKVNYPIINIGLYLLLLFIPYVDPRKKNYSIFSSAYYKIRIAISSFLSIVLLMVLLSASGTNIHADKSILILAWSLILLCGNFMSNIKPNWFFGIRTPWTLDNKEVWRRTHHFGSRLWVGGGITGILVVLLLNGKAEQIAEICIFATIVVVPIIYSYLLFKKEKIKNEPGT